MDRCSRGKQVDRRRQDVVHVNYYAGFGCQDNDLRNKIDAQPFTIAQTPGVEEVEDYVC